MIARASGAPYRTQQLNNELHRLHALASSPSIKTMATHCGLGTGTIHRLFSSATLPKPAPLLTIVEYLAKQCWKVDADAECDRFDGLYRKALDEWIPDPFPARTDEDGEDDEDPGPCAGLGAGPKPPKPSGPRGALPAGPKPPQIGWAHEPPRARPDAKHSGKSRALFIGFGLEEFRNTLAGFFPDGTDLLTNPTRDEIWHALTKAIASTTGTLLVYFGGQAIRDERTSDVVLATADTRVTGDGLVDNTIALQWVRYFLTQAAAVNVVLLLDVCLGDAVPRDPLSVLPGPSDPEPAVVLRERRPRPVIVVGNNVDAGPALKDLVTARLAAGVTNLGTAIRTAAAGLRGGRVRTAHGGDGFDLPRAMTDSAEADQARPQTLEVVGTLLVHVDDRGVSRLWDPVTGRLVNAWPRDGDAVGSPAYAPIPALRQHVRRRWWASAGPGGDVELWDLMTGEQLGVLEVGFQVRACAWLPDGLGVAVVGDTGEIYLVAW